MVPYKYLLAMYQQTLARAIDNYSGINTGAAETCREKFLPMLIASSAPKIGKASLPPPSGLHLKRPINPVEYRCKVLQL